jgi:hypothetical protein
MGTVNKLERAVVLREYFYQLIMDCINQGSVSLSLNKEWLGLNLGDGLRRINTDLNTYR